MLSCIFGKNDWVPVWSRKGIWEGTQEGKIYNAASCSFEIDFSPSRNRYRMKTHGYIPKRHTAFAIACAKMAEILKINTGEKNG